jgi:hypothetical protein
VTFVFDKMGTITSAGAVGVPGRAASYGIYGGTGQLAGATGTLRATFGQSSNDWVLRITSK